MRPVKESLSPEGPLRHSPYIAFASGLYTFHSYSAYVKSEAKDGGH